MKINTDNIAHYNALLDTPFSARIRTNGGEVRSPNSASEAFDTPGCHVKSRETKGSWPRYFGRLVSRDLGIYVVASKPPGHGENGQPTVWTGSFAEYTAMWKCD